VKADLPIYLLMPTQIDTEFAGLLAPRFRLDELDRHSASVFGLWRDYRIAYINSAWSVFAEENNGQPDIEQRWTLGSRYLAAVPQALRPFYEALLGQAPDPGSSLQPVSHVYECSSASHFRKFSMQIYALQEHTGFVIVNSLFIEVPHDPFERQPQLPDPDRYVDSNGNIVQCSHCRRVQHVSYPSRWDWVPAWVSRSPGEASHSICSICLDYYYPDEAV
jgi:hypothetical protein